MKEIYFDHSATTAVKREVLNEMIPYFNLEYGNPSSLYYIGREAKRAIECARRKVARAINCCEEEVYFTSCGSESDNLAIKGFAYANRCRGNHIITSKIEHTAVLNTCKNLEHKGFRVTYLNVDENGFIDINQLKRNICNDTILISIMMANNELGTIQNIQEIGKIAHRNNIVFHTDAVQAVGNIKIDVQSMNVDMLSMSAHKFYGPKGVGALYVRKGINFERIQDGGHQEKNKRSGTENVAGIVGLGKAIEIATYNIDRYNKKLLALRQYCISKLIENIKDNQHLHRLNISLHSYKESYHVPLNTYLNNIFNIIDKMRDKTYITLRLWIKDPNTMNIINYLNNRYKVNITSISNNQKIKITNNLLIDTFHCFIWPDLNNNYYEELGTCKGLIDHIGILSDGTIIPCCLDSKGIINLGNIYSDSLEVIYNKEIVKNMIKGFKENKKVNELCKHCHFLEVKNENTKLEK